jgi:hypothetical protein
MIELGLEIARDHAFDVISGVALLVCGWWFGRWRTTRQWVGQEFFSRIHISLTMLHNGMLDVRTLGERSCLQVFGNEEAARAIAEAARRAPLEDPILDLPRERYWSFLNSVVNEVSSLCAGGFIAADLGATVRRGTYVVCLTCERAAEVRTRKVRVLVVRKDQLLALPATMPVLRREQDVVRWQTLQRLAMAYAATPWRFVDVELVTS